MLQRIIELRKYLGLSQEQFASKLGLSRSFINQVETGKKRVSDRTIADICREFRVNEGWLRFGTGEMFQADSNDELKSLIAKYRLSYSMGILIEKLINLPEGAQESIVSAILDLAQAMTPDKESVSDQSAPKPSPSAEQTSEPTLREVMERLAAVEQSNAELQQSNEELKRQNAALQQQVDEIQAEDAAEAAGSTMVECLARQSAGDGSP